MGCEKPKPVGCWLISLITMTYPSRWCWYHGYTVGSWLNPSGRLQWNTIKWLACLFHERKSIVYRYFLSIIRVTAFIEFQLIFFAWYINLCIRIHVQYRCSLLIVWSAFICCLIFESPINMDQKCVLIFRGWRQEHVSYYHCIRYCHLTRDNDVLIHYCLIINSWPLY